jgi:hypothetical protein
VTTWEKPVLVYYHAFNAWTHNKYVLRDAAIADAVHSTDGISCIGDEWQQLADLNVMKTTRLSLALAAFGNLIVFFAASNPLEAQPVTPCEPPPAGLVAWWRAENNADDSVNTNNGAPVGGVTYTSGEVGQAFSFDNINTSTSYIPLPASTSLDIGSGNGMTIECWIKPDAAVLPGGAPIIEWDSATTDGVQLWVGLYAAIKDTFGNANLLQAPAGLLNTNTFQHVAVTYDKSSGNAFLYYNGGIVASANFGNITPQTTYPVNIGRRTGQPVANGSNYGGLIDELSLYNRALSSNEIIAIYNAGSAGKCSSPMAPVILTQPTNQTVIAGTNAIFTVLTASSLPMSYQWNFNGTNIDGATNTSLTLANVQPDQQGNYAVLVTNSLGWVLSSNAFLTVLAEAPIITNQPASLTNTAGATAIFSVTAGGSLPLSYQWSFNGTNIVDGTNATLTLINVQTNQTGTYAVLVTNNFGSVTSSNAMLTVTPPPACTPLPLGLVSWWRAENNTLDSIGTNYGVMQDGGTYAAGEVGQAFSLNGTGGFVSVPDSPGLNPSNAITIECWMQRQAAVGGNDPLIKKAGMSGGGQANGYTIEFSGSSLTFWIYTGTWHSSASYTIQPGLWYHIAAVYDNTNLLLYVNGLPRGSVVRTSGSIIPSNNPLSIGSDASNPTRFFNGLIDEVSIYSRALSSNEIAAIYGFGAGGKCIFSTAPIIYAQPTNKTATAGSTASFTAIAGGTIPLFYQWSFNGTNIAWGTNASLTLTNVQLSQMGNYSLLVANGYGSVASSNAALIVQASPTIITQPASWTNFVGAPVTFNVVASGSTPMTNQWKKNGVNIVGALATNFTIPGVVITNAGIYSVAISNAFGGILSSNAVLVVNPLFHFVWNTIPSPRFVGSPFTVTIQAQNPTNGLAANFTNAVILSSTNGVTVAPTVSGNFIQGVWTGAVTIARTATNLVLQATDNYGESGLANIINIVNLPPLATIPAGEILYFLWPTNAPGFGLETTAGLSPADWIPITGTPIKIDGQYVQAIQVPNTNAFYRLRLNGN